MYLFEFIIPFDLECRGMSSFVRLSFCCRDSVCQSTAAKRAQRNSKQHVYDLGARPTASLDVLLDECGKKSSHSGNQRAIVGRDKRTRCENSGSGAPLATCAPALIDERRRSSSNGTVVSTRSGKPNLEALKNKRGVDPICDALPFGVASPHLFSGHFPRWRQNRLQDAV